MIRTHLPDHVMSLTQLWPSNEHEYMYIHRSLKLVQVTVNLLLGKINQIFNAYMYIVHELTRNSENCNARKKDLSCIEDILHM